MSQEQRKRVEVKDAGHGKGRGLFACENIHSGYILFEEVSLASTVFLKDVVCHFCWRRLLDGKKFKCLQDCDFAHYCSELCRALHFGFHFHVCELETRAFLYDDELVASIFGVSASRLRVSANTLVLRYFDLHYPQVSRTLSKGVSIDIQIPNFQNDFSKWIEWIDTLVDSTTCLMDDVPILTPTFADIMSQQDHQHSDWDTSVFDGLRLFGDKLPAIFFHPNENKVEILSTIYRLLDINSFAIGTSPSLPINKDDEIYKQIEMLNSSERISIPTATSLETTSPSPETTSPSPETTSSPGVVSPKMIRKWIQPSFEVIMGYGFMPNSALLNHSCDPNCSPKSSLIKTTAAAPAAVTKETARAALGPRLRMQVNNEVEKGDELTVSYVNKNWPRKKRQFVLKRDKNFECQCSRCVEAFTESQDRFLEGVYCPDCYKNAGDGHGKCFRPYNGNILLEDHSSQFYQCEQELKKKTKAHTWPKETINRLIQQIELSLSALAANIDIALQSSEEKRKTYLEEIIESHFQFYNCFTLMSGVSYDGKSFRLHRNHYLCEKAREQVRKIMICNPSIVVEKFEKRLFDIFGT